MSTSTIYHCDACLEAGEATAYDEGNPVNHAGWVAFERRSPIAPGSTLTTTEEQHVCPECLPMFEPTGGFAIAQWDEDSQRNYNAARGETEASDA